MAVLIINRRGLSDTPYHKWIEGEDLVLMTSAAKAAAMTVSETRKYRSVVALERFRSAEEFKAATLRISKRATIDRIIALSEYDLIRAARAREWLKVPGQNFDSALHFRDKVVMKSALQRAGVPAPEFEPVSSLDAVSRFIARTGRPAILKARKASGSVGLWPLRSAGEVSRLPPDLFETSPADRWMIETFIEGEIYHVDGLVGDGALSFATASRYLYPSHLFSEGSPGGSYLLSAESQLSKDLVAFAEACLAALPTPETTTFHADVFRTSDGVLLAGEIACRTAGNRIRDVIRISSGIDLDEALVRWLFRGRPEAFAPVNGRNGLAGWAALRKLGGSVKSTPEPPRFEWLRDWRFGAKVGDQLAAPRSSIDNILTFVVTAEDEATLRERLQLGLDWGRATLSHCIEQRDLVDA